MKENKNPQEAKAIETVEAANAAVKALLDAANKVQAEQKSAQPAEQTDSSISEEQLKALAEFGRDVLKCYGAVDPLFYLNRAQKILTEDGTKEAKQISFYLTELAEAYIKLQIKMHTSGLSLSQMTGVTADDAIYKK